MDPRTRLALLVSLGAFAVLLDRPASLALLAAVAAVPLLTLPIGWVWRRFAVLAALAVVWSTVLSQGLFYGEVPRVPLVELGPLVLYREGVLHGLVQSLRLVAMAFAGIAVAVSTPPDRLFAALIGLRVPYAVSFLAVTALRFAPLVGRELWVVRTARARRGRPAGRRNPWAWLRLEMMLLRPAVARALRRARSMAESLDARGFDPLSPRAIRRPLRMAWWEPALLAAVFAALLWVTALELAYWAYLAEVAYHPSLRPLYGWVRAWL